MFVMPDINRYFRNKETWDLGRGDRTVNRSWYVPYLTLVVAAAQSIAIEEAVLGIPWRA
jgi:hypothetical protein